MEAKGGSNRNKQQQLKGMKIFHCSQYTTVGGAAAEEITINGLQSTDMAFITVGEAGSIYPIYTEITSNILTIGFSADPVTIAVNILVFRP